MLAWTALLAAVSAQSPDENRRDALDVQSKRNQVVAERGKAKHYTKQFDLSDLPPYTPKQRLSGKLRMWGMNYIGDAQLKDYWDEGFHRFHPEVKIEYTLPTAVTAVPALVTGQADLGANTEMWYFERLEFQKAFGYAPMDVQMLTRSYDVAGWGAATGVFVHTSNPLTRITLDQLDGIFGAERRGGWIGTTWHPELARGPERNIRTWGQLGLTGEWKDRPIKVHALNLRYHTMEVMSDRFLAGSDKWNENLQMYANYLRPDGQMLSAALLVMQSVANDPYAIGLTVARPFTSLSEPSAAETKALPLARTGDGPAVPLTLETVHNRTYPLSGPYYWTVNHKPGRPLDPLVKEYLTYVLSREGQEDVMRDAKFLPLTADVVREERRKLELDAVEPTPPAEEARGRSSVGSYSKRWDLSSLPHYRPMERVAGTIRVWGMPQLGAGNLGKYWQEGFRRYQPGVTIEYRLPSSLSGTSALITGAADIAASPRLRFSKLLGFQRLFKCDPLEIPMVTGSYDVPGWADAQAIFVHKDNPIARLTMRQLDGVFGAARNGGWVGTTWHPEVARGREGDIRTWGQLGLTGEWGDKPIHVYGLHPRYGTSIFISDTVLRGSDQWNETLREYATYSKRDGSTVSAAAQLMADLGKDRYGIAYAGIEHMTPQTRHVALAAKDGGPYVDLTMETVQDRTYPLAREQYWYVNRAPGQPVDPRIREFLSYVLSQEGQQEAVRDGKFLPLTAEKARTALALLE
jgi:ABC-type phosphate transport system substrate-binding protein